jgi:homoserine O-acetyltransferase/O-succinyltransferase
MHALRRTIARSILGRSAVAAAALNLIAMFALSVAAAEYPAPKEGEWIARDFKFHTGDVLPELRIHYATVGNLSGTPVVVLHGTGGSSASMLTPTFAGTMFGRGQPLDAAKHFIIIPDSIGHGKSSKPSDGLKAKFPKYNYADMVEAQYRLLTEGLGVRHVRLIIGFSMGGMHAWIWGEKHPEYMDALVPMASQPTGMSGRNWMLRRMLLETIRRDPGYNNGEYTSQPPIVPIASAFFGIATAGGTLNYQKLAPTREDADKLVDKRLASPVKTDANDFIWAWASSADYDASAELGRIQAAVLAINSADDERNPPETGIMEAALKRVKKGKLYLIPASDQTRGHLTTVLGQSYAKQLHEFLQSVPQPAN